MGHTLRLIAAGLLCAGLSFVSVAQAQELTYASRWHQEVAKSPVFAELDGYAAAGQSRQVEARILGMVQQPPTNINEVMAAAYIVTKYSFDQKDTQKLDLTYYLLYTDIYFLLAQLETRNLVTQKEYLRNALAGVMAYEALALTDNIRCNAPADWNEIKKTHLFPRLRKIAPAYLSYQPDAYKGLMQFMLDYEEKNVSRLLNPALCADPAAAARGGGAMFADPYSWTKMRNEAHGLLLGFWTKRYQDATKLSLTPEPEQP